MDTLQRELEHLQVLVEIKASRSEKKTEDRLAVVLIGLLVIVYDDDDYDKFFVLFLNELEKAYQKLDPSGDYGDLIDAELAVQRNYLLGFVNDLKGGRISEAQAEVRAGQYAKSLGSLREQIRLRGLGDKAQTWHYDHSIEEERHCDMCKGLNGVSRPARVWLQMGLFPKSIKLTCGTNCYCSLR